MKEVRQTQPTLESVQNSVNQPGLAGGELPSPRIELPPARLSAEIIAHRTAGRLAPENTPAGLLACMRQGCEWAEVDVRRTADGRHVLLHDETLDRTTNGSGRVADLTLKAVQEFRIAGSEQIPTLREILDLAHSRIRLYLDCRDVRPGELLAEVREAGMLEEVMIFIEPGLHKELRAMGGRRALLVSYFDPSADRLPPAGASDGPLALEIPAAMLTEPLIEAAGREGLSVECLALGSEDNPATWQRAIEMGVRWVMTDFPDLWAGKMSPGPSRNV